MNTGHNTKALADNTRRAKRNLALKLALESTFKRELNTYFNKVIKLFKRTYSETATIPTQNDINKATQTILKKHYIRSNKVFRNEMRLYLLPEEKTFIFTSTKQTDDLEQEIEDTVKLASSIFITNEVPKRASILDDTTVKNMQESVDKANMDLAKEGKPQTKENIIDEASKNMKDKFDGRIGTIALTETQFIAESTKGIEASVVSSDASINANTVATSVLVTNRVATKTWATMGDDRVRDAHVFANGQKKNLLEPFVVGGEFLPYPGSFALGASAGNVINCRCSALYGIL